jgi:hypothetical protein
MTAGTLTTWEARSMVKDTLDFSNNNTKATFSYHLPPRHYIHVWVGIKQKETLILLRRWIARWGWIFSGDNFKVDALAFTIKVPLNY